MYSILLGTLGICDKSTVKTLCCFLVMMEEWSQVMLYRNILTVVIRIADKTTNDPTCQVNLGYNYLWLACSDCLHCDLNPTWWNLWISGSTLLQSQNWGAFKGMVFCWDSNGFDLLVRWLEKYQTFPTWWFNDDLPFHGDLMVIYIQMVTSKMTLNKQHGGVVGDSWEKGWEGPKLRGTKTSRRKLGGVSQE